MANREELIGEGAAARMAYRVLLSPDLELGVPLAICLAMNRRRILRLRAVALLAALMLGIVGQTVAALAMAESAHPPMSSMTMPSDCSGCAGAADDMSTLPACALALCAYLPAAATQAPLNEAFAKAIYPLIAADIGRGITIRPDPGPPKPLHDR